MSTPRFLRRTATYLSLAGGAALIPSALDAACNMSTNPVTGNETITCCGATACCTTVWNGTTLVKKTCM